MSENNKLKLALTERLRFEELISNLSARFVNLPASEIDNQIEAGLKAVVEAMGVDRSSFFQFSPDRTKMIITHSFAKAGFERTPRMQVGKDFPWVMSKLESGDVLLVVSLKDLPKDAALDRENMERIHIKSTLGIPILFEGSFAYVLTLGNLKSERNWDADLIPRLRIIGEVFANALSRKHTQDELEEHQEQIRDIQSMIQNVYEHSPSAIYFKDLEGRCLLANRAFADRVDLEPEEIIGKTDFDLFPKEIADSYREADLQVIETGKSMKFEDLCPHSDGMHAYISVKFPLRNKIGEISGIGGISTDINELKKGEEALRERLNFQCLISELSAKFVNLPAKEVDRQIKNGLKRTVEFLGVDRSSLFQFSEDHKDFIITHFYTVKGRPQLPKIRIKKELPHLSTQWRQGKEISFASREELPDEAAADIKKTDLVSGAAIPLSIEDSFDYVLTIGTVKTERTWPDDLIQRLRLIGEIFVNALERKNADEKINSLMKQLKSDYVYLREEIDSEHEFAEIIGESPGLKYILHRISQIAPTTSPVLILGETGTGKELVARAIHRLSDRNDRPLVKVNCSALPTTLAERELFGHEKGAFTDAHKQQIGRFESANGATIFLDEIGELPLELQPKLLRVLEQGEFERLGSPRTIKVDVRVIAATNRNLEDEIRNGRFREDLYYRLNVFPLSFPPLRERKDDIPLLVNALVEKLGQKMGKKFNVIPKKTIQKLREYRWPGNVRELENLIERAMIVSPEPELEIELPGMTLPEVVESRSLEEIERSHILHVLESFNWRIKGTNGAAEILGLQPSTLRYRMQKLGIKRPSQ